MRAEGFSVTSYQLPVTSYQLPVKIHRKNWSHFDRLSAPLITAHTSTGSLHHWSLKIDEFADPQYLDPQARLPKIQALRGITSQTLWLLCLR
jgi:hypothetical protein